MTSSGRSVGSSSVIRLMYRGAMPRSVGRLAKLAASTRTQSERIATTFARIVCSSWRPVRSNSTGMVAERNTRGCAAGGLATSRRQQQRRRERLVSTHEAKLVTEPLQEGLSTLPVTAL